MKRFILVTVCLAACITGAEGGEPKGATPAAALLSNVQWASPETDLVAFLTRTPGECLAPAKNPGAEYQIELGRAAFSSPFLFGGPAARSGLSCNSCHRDGRDNDDFFLEGLSDAPGTADVTSSLFSKTREDNVFNPAPIPSLLDIAGKESFGSTAPQPSIHAFVTSAVHDEFQGVVSSAVIDGIAAYVAHLNAGFCPEGETAQSVGRAVSDITRTLRAAETAMRRGDAAAADFLLLTARHGLGLIHERYNSSGLTAEQKLVAAVSQQLADMRAMTYPGASGDLNAAAAMMSPLITGMEEAGRRLRKKERHSLYNEKRLRRVLEGE